MQLDEKHKKILKALAHYVESSYTELWEKLGIPKRTFHKKLYELIEGKLVERYPPSNKPTAHIGKKVKFKLTAKGVKTAKVQEFLLEFERRYQNLLERLVEHSLEIGKGKPLTGSIFYLISKNLPICTIAHLPSKQQYEKLKPKLENDMVRQELGMLINKLIEFYLENINKGLFQASYQSAKQSVFYMGFLPEKETNMVQDLVNEGLFQNEYILTRGLMKIAFFSTLHSIYNKLRESRKFREGKEGLRLSFDCYYNPQTKEMEPISQTKLKKGVSA
jgi:DNA-binding Lrp family transcriptional regulator